MVSLKRIVVPVDFSEPAKVALSAALSLARRLDARTYVVHVVPEVGILLGSGATETQALGQTLVDAAKRDIPDLIPADYWVNGGIETSVIRGDIDGALLRFIRDYSIDLVAMGTHGRRAAAHWFAGSVTESLLRRMPVPILTVSHVDRTAFSTRNILYATDLSEESTAGFRFVTDFARMSGARLMVLHVIDRLGYGIALGASNYLRNVIAEQVKSAKLRLTQLIAREKRVDMNIASVVVEGVPSEQILRVAALRHADLVAINLKSKTAAERAFLGATAERVVRMAEVPVLAVPLAGRKAAYDSATGV